MSLFGITVFMTSYSNLLDWCVCVCANVVCAIAPDLIQYEQVCVCVCVSKCVCVSV